MNKLALNLLCSVCLLGLNTTHHSPKLTRTRQFPYIIQVIAENLYVPWAIAISNDGKLYFTERSGSIRVIENGMLLSQPLITFTSPFISQGEGGLMGLTLDPSFSQNRYMYAMHSYIEDGRLYNRVIRLIENNNRASIDHILLDKIPGGQFHNGGRLKVGPDQMLYITTGDITNPSLAQDLNSLAGKILRITLNGDIPADNPFPNSLIYSFGHRNPQGLAWNKENILYASEHGPSAHDEINIIYPGANYGWPLNQGNESSPSTILQQPLISSGEETWAPSGITFINQGPWQNNLLVATLRGQRLLNLSLNTSGTVVENLESWLSNDYGRLREAIQGPDGSIYISTSNRDGRDNATSVDDMIIRLIPNWL